MKLAAGLLLGLGTIGLVSRAPRPIHGGIAWPSVDHWLGVDAVGRDFLAVLGAGTADFAVPGLLAVLILLAVEAAAAHRALARPAVGTSLRVPPGVLALASPPRLLLVMLAMLLLAEPNAFVAAAVVLALYAPVALDETAGRLRQLADEEVLAGLVAHGLPRRRILGRHLLRGHLAEPVGRHAATLFSQVALTQVALSYVFGGSSTTAGLGVAWGMEFRRLAATLPTASTQCLGEGPCPESVAAFQAACLLGACLVVFGGLGRAARPAVGGRTA